MVSRTRRFRGSRTHGRGQKAGPAKAADASAPAKVEPRKPEQKGTTGGAGK